MKKGLIFIIVVIMMVSLLPVAAFAEAGDFYIDSANKYEGMTDTYGSGKPYAESNGSVNIVLPLIGNIDGKDITATLDVGPVSYTHLDVYKRQLSGRTKMK